MSSQERTAYKRPSSFKRFINSIDFPTRWILGITVAIFITTSDIITQAIRNGNASQERKMWAKTELRDLEKHPYSKFDIETSPKRK